ncbi:hypothetical protein [Streptomyces sp. DH12]|uniref:hypothetical protein n=1 Tax=Streptomyces sp. DH12 TaxID=2857010 RepID=UPI001E65C3AA|nr:hypothetical protein [Streptomyces sp. DH12]
MTAGGPRVLLNAQPFGFGPSAAAAVMADELAGRCGGLGYVGGDHTLDLQHVPPYAEVHDVTGASEAAALARLRALAARYDVLLTAMDFTVAGLARRAGLGVVVYDALAWYWPRIPPVARDAAVLYVAQDFFGVRERLAADPVLAGRAVVVPPIIVPGPPWRPGGDYVLVNLGGLHHPLWRRSDAFAYARLAVAAVRAGTPPDLPVVVAASGTTARALHGPAGGGAVQGDGGGGTGGCGTGDGEGGGTVVADGTTVVGTYGRQEVLRLLRGAAYTCMTPGLGNVYDAAATGVPTVWLPPANNTQGLQAVSLARHGCCDARVDWADLGRPVDYRAPESEVVARLAAAVREADGDGALRARLAGRLAEAAASLGGGPGRARSLARRFGHGGARETADAVVEWAGRWGDRPPG